MKILLTDSNRWPVAARLAVAFRRMGCDVAVLCPVPGHPAQSIPAVEHIFGYDGLSPLESLARAIVSFQPDIVIPACDRSVAHLHELYAMTCARDGADAPVAVMIERSLGSPASFPIVSRRCELLHAAESEGIRIPKTMAIETEADLERWSAESERPWVMKADGTWGGKGVRLVSSHSDALRFFQEFSRPASIMELGKRLLLNRNRAWEWAGWKDARHAVIAQTAIDGRPANCAVVCWQGKVLASLAVEVLRAREVTGPATVVRLIPGVEMIAAAEKLASRFHLSGFFGLDFMIEESTGAAYLIEMNPRCTPPCHLALDEGRNLPAALYAQLTGEPAPLWRPVIDREIIAYFPRGVEAVGSATHNDPQSPVYLDIPVEPALTRALLHPRSGRSIVGRLCDMFRQDRKSGAYKFAALRENAQPRTGAKQTISTLA
ncbi:MAG TPA: ATP-grasp domain-containing protein [Terracidiphilus sp.]|nr:ATP-grasp domain-containing protein [Terracidiphilus sp.]